MILKAPLCGERKDRMKRRKDKMKKKDSMNNRERMERKEVWHEPKFEANRQGQK